MADSAIEIGSSSGVLSLGYCIREIRLDQAISPVVATWQKCNAEYHNDLIHNDPEWLLEFYKADPESVRIFLLERDDEIVGAVPFALSRVPLKLQFGGFTLGKIDVRRWVLLGYELSIPCDEGVYDLLFSKIGELAGEFDAIYCEYTCTDSFLWKYIHSSHLVGKFFRFYSQYGVMPHPYIRVDGTFESYMQYFPSKIRTERNRKLKKLREQGDVELVRVSSPQDVGPFVEIAAEIARKSWQFSLLNTGFASLSQEAWIERLMFAAERGCLRSYFLKCNGVPCAFELGYQYKGRFYFSLTGYDPSWSKFGVGATMIWLVIKDIFEHNRPDVCDFATYADYKQSFANDSYSEATMWLLPRRAYPMMVFTLYRAYSATAARGSALLDRLKLKSKVKQLIRKMGKRS
jgi:GNAT acetyltransferase-like protein